MKILRNITASQLVNDEEPERLVIRLDNGVPGDPPTIIEFLGKLPPEGDRPELWQFRSLDPETLEPLDRPPVLFNEKTVETFVSMIGAAGTRIHEPGELN